MTQTLVSIVIGLLLVVSGQVMQPGIEAGGRTEIVLEVQQKSAMPYEAENLAGILRRRLTYLKYQDASVSYRDDGKFSIKMQPALDSEKAYALAELLCTSAELTFCDVGGAVVLDGSNVAEAVAEFGQTEQDAEAEAFVKLRFTFEGQQKFKEATAAAAARAAKGGNYISVLVDGVEISRPRVESEIDSDSCIIHGGLKSLEEAEALAEYINFGILPYTLNVIEIHSVN